MLERLAAGPAVLIIDQADAVSEMSGRSAQLRKLVIDLIRQAVCYPHLRIVFSCRSFDLDNDHGFRALASAENARRIDLKPLDWDGDVVPVLTRFGIQGTASNMRLRALLCLPLGLLIAVELSRSGVTNLRSVEHLSQLYDRLISERNRELSLKPRVGRCGSHSRP